MSDDDQRQRVERSRRLTELCTEPGGLFDIMDSMKRAMLQQAIDAKPEDVATQSECLRMVRCMDKLATRLASAIQSGAVDKAEIAQQAEEEAKRLVSGII